MAVFNLTNTMDGLAALALTSGLPNNVYAFPVPNITTPCTVIGYPTQIDFDLTFGRGSDRASLPVWVVVGTTGNKDARDRLSAILADTSSIKSAFDGNQSFGSVRVVDARITEITVGAINYLAVEFTIDVIS